jgi:DNA-binding CsgD family transcriptional regulator
MPQIDIDALVPLCSKFTQGCALTPSESAEVIRIAQGFACKDSAAAAGVSPETIRARRKRIYRKLHVAGASELISGLLAASLDAAAGRAVAGARPDAHMAASGSAPSAHAH